jgi:glycosyltransferase involved in cell wall biosynthesis
MRVIISCSGKFHAFNLVEQLQKHGVDVVFFTSYSSITNSFFKYFVSRRDLELVIPETIHTNIFIAIGLKIFKNNSQIFNNIFDLWVAHRIRRLDADIFIGWSSMSYYSIREAKKKGMKTIVERGSAHIKIQNDLLIAAYQSLGKQFGIGLSTISKEILEYGIADYISIPSNFCYRTFLDAEVDEHKLIINPYGVSDYFYPVQNSSSECTTILFLGKLSVQKGVHLLLPILENFIQDNLDFKFIFIGAIEADIKNMINDMILRSTKIMFLGHVDHYKLNDEIGKCDVAVLPSIQDGFAMVAVQILKVGLPLIISKNAGAEQLITSELNGWVVEPTIEEIRAKLLWCIHNLSSLKRIRSNIVKSDVTSEMSWANYGIRYLDFLVTMNNEK